MAQLPTDTVASGEINTREVIMGANKDEGLLTTWPFILGRANLWRFRIRCCQFCIYIDPSLYDYVRDNWEGFGPSWLFSKRVSEEESWVTQQDIDQAWQVLVRAS